MIKWTKSWKLHLSGEHIMPSPNPNLTVAFNKIHWFNWSNQTLTTFDRPLFGTSFEELWGQPRSVVKVALPLNKTIIKGNRVIKVTYKSSARIAQDLLRYSNLPIVFENYTPSAKLGAPRANFMRGNWPEPNGLAFRYVPNCHSDSIFLFKPRLLWLGIALS